MTSSRADESAPDAVERRIPVTVVSGVLGAGKTTLVNHLLSDPGGRRLAVIVNDVGEVNVDADLVRREGEEGVVDLSNGCVCCELTDDLLTEVDRLADAREFDCLVVETSGVSAPAPVARAFLEGTETSDVDPTERFRLDAMVTVLDAYGFHREFDPSASLPGGAGGGTDDARPLADALVESAEFCDVLLVNKCDLLEGEAVDEVEAAVRELGPEATVVRTTHAEVDPDLVLDTGRFDYGRISRAAGWKRRLREGDADHGTHAHDRVDSFVYRRERAFHPERFAEWLRSWDGDLLRAKGVFLLAGRERTVMGLSQAGASVRAGPIGEWDDERDEPRTELVFIGRGLGETAYVDALDDCLLGEDEEPPSRESGPFPMVELVD